LVFQSGNDFAGDARSGKYASVTRKDSVIDENEAARMAAELSQGYGAWHMKNYAFRA
jgi:hypothetical protein